jgi:hypothetical protein
MRKALIQIFLLLLLGPLVQAAAQTPADVGNWNRLKMLPAHTKVHVAGDKQSKVCSIDVVDDATLQCSKGHSQYSFVRAEVKSVKLTRYTRSTLVGLGVGLGVGVGVGAIAGRAIDPPQPNAFLDFSGLGRDAITVIGGVGGLIAGGAIGGPTDFLRGPTVYRSR